ncbi:MAG: hypothetical protein H9Q67_07135 [Spiroplasma ixodetis]|nr:hypothetical protein [Spiroplasma ixodetis]
MNKPFDSIICSLEIHKDIQKRTINEYKEKIIIFLKEQIQDELDKGDDGIPYIDAFELIKDLENGEFDNE